MNGVVFFHVWFFQMQFVTKYIIIFAFALYSSILLFLTHQFFQNMLFRFTTCALVRYMLTFEEIVVNASSFINWTENRCSYIESNQISASPTNAFHPSRNSFSTSSCLKLRNARCTHALWLTLPFRHVSSSWLFPSFQALFILRSNFAKWTSCLDFFHLDWFRGTLIKILIQRRQGLGTFPTAGMTSEIFHFQC